MHNPVIILGETYTFPISMTIRYERNQHKRSSHGTHTQADSVSKCDTQFSINVSKRHIRSNICVETWHPIQYVLKHDSQSSQHNHSHNHTHNEH